MKPQLILCFLLTSLYISAQTSEIVNPKDKWFLGIEVGKNEIISTTSKSTQYGILGEFYFHKNWSFTGRIKYFKTGVTDFELNFTGAVISIPLNIKWEFNILENFRANLNTGIAFNKEVNSNYQYAHNRDEKFSTMYRTFNTGIGINYFASEKIGIYFNLEIYLFGNHRSIHKPWMFPNSPENKHHNFGIKFNL
jgi:hypothetical protein